MNDSNQGQQLLRVAGIQATVNNQANDLENQLNASLGIRDLPAAIKSMVYTNNTEAETLLNQYEEAVKTKIDVSASIRGGQRACSVIIRILNDRVQFATNESREALLSRIGTLTVLQGKIPAVAVHTARSSNLNSTSVITATNSNSTGMESAFQPYYLS